MVSLASPRAVRVEKNVSTLQVQLILPKQGNKNAIFFNDGGGKCWRFSPSYFKICYRRIFSKIQQVKWR